MKLVSSHFIILFSKASNNSVNKVENPLSMIIWDAALLALLKRRKNIINIIISKWFLSYGWKSSANKWKLFLLSYNLFFPFLDIAQGEGSTFLCHDSLHEHTHSLTPFSFHTQTDDCSFFFLFLFSFSCNAIFPNNDEFAVYFDGKCWSENRARNFHLLTTSFAILIFTQLPTRMRVKKSFYHTFFPALSLLLPLTIFPAILIRFLNYIFRMKRIYHPTPLYPLESEPKAE